MLSPVPSRFKSIDINRFIIRAAQLEKLKPPIAYWCYYWAVNQILSKNLHMHDDECKQYTTELMDKLEQIKDQNPTDDSILDDLAGQAYVEQFGSETFQRAENAIRVNKASKQTADTYQAAATFLTLIHIWGEPSPEIASKIKYAKYHALRIAKALVAGEDPNLSNPSIEPEEAQEPPNKVSSDDEVGGHSNLQPSVEEVQDEEVELQARMARQSSLDESLHPSRAPSIPRVTTEEVGPISNSDNPNNPQVDKSYFPEGIHEHRNIQSAAVSTDTTSLSNIPVSPVMTTTPLASSSAVKEDPGLPSLQSTVQDVSSPHEFYAQPLTNPAQHFNPSPPRAEPQSPKGVVSLPTPLASQMQQNAAVPSTIKQGYLTDDMAVLDAQKHAKWAISALNFEDVPTAVKELQAALKSLGVL